MRAMQDLPEDLLEGLALAAGQVISDMEETPAIADVPLLCGVALVRDDVLRRLEERRAGAAAAARKGRAAVPEQIAATIKELTLVADAVTRRSQLFGCVLRAIVAWVRRCVVGSRASTPGARRIYHQSCHLDSDHMPCGGVACLEVRLRRGLRHESWALSSALCGTAAECALLGC